MPTDRALRHSCSRYIRARGAWPPEAIGELVKLRAAPEIDRHTLQLSEPPRPAMAVSPSARHTNSHGHIAISRLALAPLLVLCSVSV